MLDAKDCLERADDMERRANSAGAVSLRADLMSMAETWRHLAQQALWQDAIAAQTPQDSGTEYA